jgi:hypothetical protein
VTVSDVFFTIVKDEGSFTDLLKESNTTAEVFTDKFFTVQEEKLALERDKLRQDQELMFLQFMSEPTTRSMSPRR